MNNAEEPLGSESLEVFGVGRKSEAKLNYIKYFLLYLIYKSVRCSLRSHLPLNYCINPYKTCIILDNIVITDMNPKPAIPLRVAVVKSSVYQDLWVCDRSKDPVEVFKTTLMRTSPIGFFEAFETEFLIVKYEDEYPCNINPACMPRHHFEHFQHAKENKSDGGHFLDETFHKHTSIAEVSHSVDSVDWSQFDIVLVMNMCVPSRVTSKYPKILWGTWIGENEDRWVYNRFQGYDVVLNQDVTKPGMPSWMVGCPYSFVGAFTMERIAGELGVGVRTGEAKSGVFMEINNTTQRPVVDIPWEFSRIAEETKHPIVVHSQNIVENLGRVSKSKYFVKLLGRKIRGNGILEVVSAGTLILANKNLVEFNELVWDNYVESVDDVITKIKWFDAHPEEYAAAVEMQRIRLHELYYKTPVENLARLHWEKIQKS